MIDYTQILSVNYPTARWTLDGDSYDELTWLSDTPKPTQAKLDALWESTQAARIAAKEYKESANNSAIAKLKKLGLTDDEISALKGTL